MPTRPWTLLLGALCGASWGAGCNAETARGCEKNSECPTGRSCNLLSGQCIRTFAEFKGQELEFQGTIRCKVAAPNDPTLLANSEVVGRLGGKIVPMVEATSCTLRDDSLSVQVAGTQPSDDENPSRQFLLVAKLAVGTIDGSQWLTLSPDPFEDLAQTGNAQSSLMEIDELDDTLNYVALSRAGRMRLVNGSPRLGQTVEIELEGEFEALKASQLGTACDEIYECDLNQSLLCTSMGCSTICREQEGCAESGGICTSILLGTDGAFCLAPCQTDNDCDPAFHCAHFVPDQGVCAPREILGPGDEGSVGERCLDPGDCSGGQVCVGFGGEQGVCTQPCNDGCFGVGMAVHCLEVNSTTSLCARGCADDKDCPDDLVCVNAGGVTACVPPELE